jgi:ribosomal protein S18 acetylase RimI-like enzyme
MPLKYALKNVLDGDAEWLWQLHEESYRDVVVRQFGTWNEDFQRNMFHEKWRGISTAKIVVAGDSRIGVVVVKHKESFDWLQEILLNTEYRGHGLGTSLMQQVIGDARGRCVPVRLQVVHKNHRAKTFYERLGFGVIETLENHFLMEVDQSSSVDY